MRGVGVLAAPIAAGSVRSVVLGAVFVLAMPLMAADSQQGPGDRPAANPRATRSVVLARNGMIATSQPLASAAGLRVLQQGGNAVDAAVTAAAVLAVVEPTMNGVGGDLFALVYDAKTKSVHALNASGRAPQRATPEEFKRRGLDAIPYRGELSVSVPGVVDGWSELLSRYGTIKMAQRARARDWIRPRRLRGERNHLEPVEGRRTAARARSRRCGHLSPRRPFAGSRRRVPQSPPRGDARADRPRRPRRFLQGTDRESHCRRHGAPQRAARRSRSRREQARLDRADLHELPGLRRPRAAAEHAGRGHARDAEYPGGVRHQGDAAQFGRVPAPAGGSQADGVCRS